MSTYQELLDRGIRVGDIVKAPVYDEMTLAKVTRLYFEYAMVKYVDGRTLGVKPRLLRKATAEEADIYRRAVINLEFWDRD